MEQAYKTDIRYNFVVGRSEWQIIQEGEDFLVVAGFTAGLQSVSFEAHLLDGGWGIDEYGVTSLTNASFTQTYIKQIEDFLNKNAPPDNDYKQLSLLEKPLKDSICKS